MSLGTEQAAVVLRRLSEPEVADILLEVAELEDVDADLVDVVMRVRRHRRGPSPRRSRRRGSRPPHVERGRLTPIGPTWSPVGCPRMPVPRRSPSSNTSTCPWLRLILSEEHPQAIALVLVHLAPEFAARLLRELPEALQSEIAMRIATLDRTTPEVLEIVEESLTQRFAAIGRNDHQQVGGVEALVAVLSRTDETMEKSIIESLGEHDELLADRLRAAMFSFEDLTTIDDRAIQQQVLRGVDSKDLATALKGASDTVRDKLLSNLSSRAAETIGEEIELLGRVRSAVVEEAGARVLLVVREMQEAGTIQLERGGDDFVD